MLSFRDGIVLDRMSYITDYREAMESVFPSFIEETKGNKNIMNVILSLAYPLKREEYYLITKEAIELAGANYGRAMKLLIKYPVFVDSGLPYSKFYRKAKRWIISDKGVEVYKRMITGINIYYRVEGRTKGRLDAENKIPKSIHGKSVADYSHDAIINLQSLSEYQAGENMRDNAELNRLLNLATYRNGVLNQDYVRKKTGRLYSYGSGSVQMIPREVRKAAFKGDIEYDLKNAHYRIASHYTENKFIQEYAYDSTLIRKLIANDLRLDVSQVKFLLLSLLYGAGITGKKGSSLEIEFGKEKMKEILSHAYVKNMLAGIEELTEDLQLSGNMSVMEGESAAQARASFLQRGESEILDACIAKVKPQLLLFDGFISKEDVDTEWLESIILYETGYDIQVSKEVI